MPVRLRRRPRGTRRRRYNRKWLLLASGVLGWVIRPRRRRARRAGLCRDGVRCAHIGRSRGSPAAFPARYRDAGGARSAAGPETLDGVDVHLAEAIAVLVASVFTLCVADCLVLIAPG